MAWMAICMHGCIYRCADVPLGRRPSGRRDACTKSISQGGNNAVCKSLLSSSECRRTSTYTNMCMYQGSQHRSLVAGCLHEGLAKHGASLPRGATV
jgi:hypothetical protein